METTPDPGKIEPFTPGKAAFRALWWIACFLVFGEVVFAGLAIHSRAGTQYRMGKNIFEELSKANSTANIVVSPSKIQEHKIRSVDEILQALEAQGTGKTTDQKGTNGSAPPLASWDQYINTSRAQQLSTGNDALDGLIKEAREAQIEGDMRKAILKLEEGLSQHSNHPAVLYYLGLTYEMLQNASKARDYYLLVYQQRESAGPYYAESSKKLQMGFDLAADKRGKIGFGPIRVFKETDNEDGEILTVTIPVILSPGEVIQPSNLKPVIQFYDVVNDREIIPTRALVEELPANAWLTETDEWSNEERSLVYKYHSKYNPEEIMALGDLRYYGYTAKLFYKGVPMDCKSAPNSLILEEMKKNKTYDFNDESLLPPIEAEQVSDGLLPLDYHNEPLDDSVEY